MKLILTELEKSLIDHVVRGEVFDLAPTLNASEIDRPIMQEWGDEHRIRADVLRAILLGRHLPPAGADPRGLRLRGATVMGRLDLDYLAIPIPLSLESSFLTEGLSGSHCQIPYLKLDHSVVEVKDGRGQAASVCLEGAQIARSLSLEGAELYSESGPALDGALMRVDGNASFTGGFTATGRDEDGAVDLSGATISGQLSFRGAVLSNAVGPALAGDGLEVGFGAFFVGGFTATGHGKFGTVRLPGATISKQLSFNGAELTNDSGPALHCDGMRVDGGATFDGRFTATGHSRDAAIRLMSAEIGGQLSFQGSTLSNDHGPAFAGDGMSVGGVAIFSVGFKAFGHGDLGAVRLSNSTFRNSVTFNGATLTNKDGPALYCIGMSVNGDASFRNGFTAAGSEENGVVRLSNVHINGRLGVDSVVAEHAVGGARWAVDGLVYEGYPSVGFDGWLRFLRDGTVAYAPQPYQQFAAAARLAGHESDARRVLISQRDDQVKRGSLSARAKAWAGVTKATIGYGYQPWRALVLIGANLVLAALVLFLVPDALSVLVPESQAASIGTQVDSNGTPCTYVQIFQIAVDMSIPLVATSQGSPCGLTSTYEGQFVSWFGFFSTFAGWALTALFAAGFTRAIRQP